MSRIFQGCGPSVGAEREVPAHVPARTRNRQELRSRQDPYYLIGRLHHRVHSLNQVFPSFA